MFKTFFKTNFRWTMTFFFVCFFYSSRVIAYEYNENILESMKTNAFYFITDTKDQSEYYSKSNLDYNNSPYNFWNSFDEESFQGDFFGTRYILNWLSILSIVLAFWWLVTPFTISRKEKTNTLHMKIKVKKN